MRLINLTGDLIRVFHGQAIVLELSPCLPVASMEVREDIVDIMGGVPLIRHINGSICNLPAPVLDTLYIVSEGIARVATAAGRRDVITPDLGRESVVLDRDGKVCGVQRFVCDWPKG